MENEIRTCFSLFVHHLKNSIKNLPEYKYDELSIPQIKAELNILYMKYLLNSTYLNSEKAIVITAYKHLKNMINDNKNDNNFKLLCMENFLLKQQLKDSKIIDTQTNQQLPKGWFFN